MWLGASIMIEGNFTSLNRWTDVIVEEYRHFNPILGHHQCEKMILQNWKVITFE